MYINTRYFFVKMFALALKMGKEHFLYKTTDQETRNDHVGILYLEPRDEEKIWDKFLTGDDAALSYIYQNYAKSLFNYGRHFADTEVVEDCIQDLFFDLIKSRKKIGKIISVKAYLFTSLRRKIFRKVKKSKNELSEARLDENAQFRISIASDGATPLDNLTKESLVLLRDACNALPAKQREIIMLYYYEELSYKEIAAIFGMGRVSSARILLYRALDSLNKLLVNVKQDLLVLFLGYLCFEVRS